MLMTLYPLLPLLTLMLPPTETGTVTFRPVDDANPVPERYRLEPHSFKYELEQRRSLEKSGVDIFHLRFPSALESPHPENNTVHAEYYRPRGAGPFPGVIVLDITGGDQSLSRSISTTLAQNRIACLFVQMAYYGPRRPPGSRLRLMLPNLHHTITAVRQTVLDIRRATAWLESRPEIDSKRLGILGTSLGSFLAALACEMEPKLGRAAVLLGGGGLVDAYWNHPQAAPYRATFEALGGKKEDVIKLLAPIDPITCAAFLTGRRVLMIAASKDEIVPPTAAKALWTAAGKQQIVWYDTGHYGAILYYVNMLEHVVKHFGAE